MSGMHGTVTSYATGCRCDLCRGAMRERQRKRASRGVAPNHGTASGYSNYGCRCEPCRAAWAVAFKAYRKRRAERDRTAAA